MCACCVLVGRFLVDGVTVTLYCICHLAFTPTQEAEKCKRHAYAGAVGWFSFGGDTDTCIALRTMLFKDGVAYLQVCTFISPRPPTSLPTNHTARSCAGDGLYCSP